MLQKIKFHKIYSNLAVIAFAGTFFTAQLFVSSASAQEKEKTKMQTETNQTLKEKAKAKAKTKSEGMDKSVAEMYNTGLEQLHNDDASAAAATFEAILAKDPKNVNAMVNLARAYYETKRLDEANTTIEDAIALDSTNADAYLVRGIVKSSIGKQDEATASYKKSINLNETDNPFAYNNLALIYIKDGDFSNAIPLLEKATSQKNDVVYFYNNLGIAYEGIDDLVKAKEAFNNALTIDADYGKARENLERVQLGLTKPESEKMTGK